MRAASTVRTLLRLAALAALTAIAAAIAFGYLGRLHMAFDAFSHFRIHLGAALAAMALPMLALRFRREALLALLLGTAAVVQTAGLPLPPRGSWNSAAVAEGASESAVYRLLHMNLRYDNPTPEAALSLIGRVAPDVVTLNEVSAMWVDRLALLEAAYPHRLICPPPSRIGGVAILSRRPFAAGFEPLCGDRGAFARARLDIGGREVEIATLHLGWPWPYAQPWQLPRLEPLLGEIADTAVIATDLNAVPWSFAARRVADAAHARILRGIGPTWLHERLPGWLRPWIGLPIDNILVKGGVLPVGLGSTDPTGSDHLPVVLEFVLLPQQQPPQVLHAGLGE